jgi:YD repeat-containing protein
LQETLVNTGAYTRYEYPNNGVQSKVFTTVTDFNNNGTGDSADEVMNESWADGAGRTRKSRTELPNSLGGFSGSLVEYNILGQVRRSTVPTEINSSWNPSGDDFVRGFLWMEHEYDWKGRPTKETNTDGTFKSFSYNGCGCAGGQVTTIQGELIPRDDRPTLNGRRTQKFMLTFWDVNICRKF